MIFWRKNDLFNYIQDEIPINKNRFELLQIISDEESVSEFLNPTHHTHEDQITAYSAAHKSKHRKTSNTNWIIAHKHQDDVQKQSTVCWRFND